MSWKGILKRFWPQSGHKADRIPGYLTQYPETDNRDRKQRLIIGLDFGTGFTKVVIGETRVFYAVPFSSYSNGKNIYLLPGVLSVGQENECYLGEHPDATRRVSDLKMRLLQGDYSATCQVEIVSFLALVLRHCRAWLLNEHKNTYKGQYIDWFVNTGLPTDSYHSDKLTEVYQNIVQAAWFASIQPGPIILDNTQCFIESGRYQFPAIGTVKNDIATRMLHPDAFGLFPEFVAQVTGYVRSPLRQPDLHIIVDVGAGTVDVTVFNVHEKDGEDIFPVFAKSVEPLGVQYLVIHRLNMNGYTGDWKPEAQDVPLSEPQFASRLGLTRKELHTIDASFRKKVHGQILSLLSYTKKQRYPKSRKWHDGVPLFMSGGGAKVDFYDDLISSMEHGECPYKLSRTHLPKPEQLAAEGLPRDGYDRLSVAYGLSFDALDIGKVIKDSEIEDATENIQPTEPTICGLCCGTGEPMGRCPKCNGKGWTYIP